MTILVEFLLENWRGTVIAVLMASLTLVWNLWTSEKEHNTELEFSFHLKVAQAEAAAKEVEVRSQKTLETINANHDAVLAQAQANAKANTKALLARLASRVTVPVGVPDLSPITPASGAADSTRALDVATIEQLIDQCAATTVQVNEFQTFVRNNKLPVEGE